MTINLPRLATEDDAAELVPLFCSGKDGMHLATHVCSQENRENLLKSMTLKCASECVWMVTIGSMPAGILLFDRLTTSIGFVVVSENLRGQGIGPTLVRHIQSMPDVSRLHAEARNDSSKRMLRKCEFWPNGRKSHDDFPLFFWRRKSADQARRAARGRRSPA